MGDHVVIAVWQANAGQEERLGEVLRTMVEPSLGEPGCLAYQVHRSADDASTFMLYERYRDAAAYEEHQRSDHFAQIARGQGFPLLASRVRSTYEALAGGIGAVKITDIRATTVAIPLEAPLRHANGGHWGRFVRTIVEVDTDEGLTGLGELRGSGAATEDALRGLRPYLVGHDPFDLEAMRFKLLNPTAALYGNRTALHSALEFACIDLMGKYLDVPASQLLGGRVRDAVKFGSYLFFRYPNDDGHGEVRRPEDLVGQARELKARHGFATHKLKGGVFPPEYELECYLALAEAFPADGLRYDPNAVLSVEESIRFGTAIEHVRNDYLEDPTWGLNGMRRVRERVGIPLATNTVVVNFEQLATNVLQPAVDVILLDTTFWGGIRPCLKAAGVCETFQLSVAMHSSGEVGIQLATMLHLGAVLPALPFAVDTHYHHLADDVIVGGKMTYTDGAIAVPTGPGLGVELDPDRMERYAAYYRETGNYTYDRDPRRPGWFPLVPNERWGDPTIPGVA